VGSQIKGSKNITFGQDFSNKLSSEIQDKDTNIVLYSFDEGDNSPKEAANTLKADGYTNVYYYMGIADDLILDKRIN
jgi:rhodanese-related sulfurtransferase